MERSKAKSLKLNVKRRRPNPTGVKCSPSIVRLSAFGFTLIEILVYIAILAVLSVAAVNMLLLVSSSLAEIRVTRSINAAAASSLERIIRQIRDADAVNVGSSTLGSSPGVLSLSGSESPVLIHRFSVSGGTLFFQSGSNTPIGLTASGLTVTNLVFRLITTSTTSQAVKVELTLAASTGKATTTQNFYGTAVLRNSYSP